MDTNQVSRTFIGLFLRKKKTLFALAFFIFISAVLLIKVLNHGNIYNSMPALMKQESKLNTNIPRTVYLFWDKGLNASNLETKISYKSWKYMNPTFTVKLLDREEIEELTNRSKYIPDSFFDTISVPAQSDIYRTLLIYENGGIWADVSLQSSIALEDWLNLNATDLTSFIRENNAREQKEKDLFPWITSWFLAAPKHSYLLGEIRKVLLKSSEWSRIKKEYFWWHRIVSELARNNTRIKAQIDTYPSARYPHGSGSSDFYKVAPVFKRCATGKMIRLLDTAEKCCPKSTSLHKGFLCQIWNCSSLGANWMLVSKMEKIGSGVF